MSYAKHFDLDIPHALVAQLVAVFDKVEPGLLSQVNINDVEQRQGVYQLFHKDKLVYVGKADDLRVRLTDHLQKIEGRRGIDVTDVRFRCLYIGRNWSATAPEETLIKHYRSQGLAEWNGIGFGPHDPGRGREETKKKRESFDTNYPIRDDWPCDFVLPGTHDVLQLLISLKRNLPFLLRYETEGGTDEPDKKAHYTKGHPDFVGKSVLLARAGMPVREILKLLVELLPGWQATVFPSHMTLYKEDRKYKHGEKL